MARRSISLDEKIEKAQITVASTKAKYDAAVKDLEKLLSRKRELQSKELLKAFAESDKTYDEIMSFLKPSKGTDDIES